MSSMSFIDSLPANKHALHERQPMMVDIEELFDLLEKESDHIEKAFSGF